MKFPYPLNTLIYDLPEAEYHAAQAISRSYLKKMQVSPAEAQMQFNSSTAMGLGTAGHLLVLEGPDVFDDKVLEAPTKTAGVKFTQLAEANPDKVIVGLGGRQQASEMVAGMFNHPQAAEILLASDIKTEVSVFWLDEETGLYCKCRVDFMVPSMSIIGDLKFVQKGGAGERKFRYAMRDYGYDLQAPWYTEGIAKATGQVYEHFLFLVTESVEPNFTGVFEMDRDWMGESHFANHDLLKMEKYCREQGFWPNYDPDNAGIQTLVPYY